MKILFDMFLNIIVRQNYNLSVEYMSYRQRGLKALLSPLFTIFEKETGLNAIYLILIIEIIITLVSFVNNWIRAKSGSVIDKIKISLRETFTPISLFILIFIIIMTILFQQNVPGYLFYIPS